MWSALVSFTVVLLFTISGIYLEDNETIVAAINYGVLGEMGNEQYWSDSLVFLFPPLFHLSKNLPTIPVFGIFKLLTQFTVFWAITVIAIRTFANKVMYIMILVVAACVFLYDSLFQLHCIRQSVLLSFAALYLHSLEYDNNNRLRATPLLLFFFAVITRIHAAALILFAFIAYDVLRKPLGYTFGKYKVMFAFTLMLLGLYQLNGKFTSNMGRYIEAHFEYPILEKPHIAPLTSASKSADTARYLGLKSFFFTDTAQYTREYFHQFVRIQPTLSFVFDPYNISAIKQDISKRWRDTSYLLISIVILLCLFVCTSPGHAKESLLFTWVMFLVPAGLILLLTNELKERFFNSYIGILSWLLLLKYLVVFEERPLPKFVRISLPILVLIAIAIFGVRQVIYYHPLHVQLSQVHEAFLKNSKDLVKQTTGERTLFFSNAEIPLTNDPFYRTPETLYQNFATFDGGYLTYYSYCVERFTKLFGYHPGDFRKHTELLTNSKEGVLAYITKDRIQLISFYFLHLYKVKLDFTKVSDIHFCEADIYRVKAYKI